MKKSLVMLFYNCKLNVWWGPISLFWDFMFFGMLEKRGGNGGFALCFLSISSVSSCMAETRKLNTFPRLFCS